ncbi:SDR family NAD(P)-dependent oxidoreductase, partial [Psychrobacter sp. 16-Bac2893]
MTLNTNGIASDVASNVSGKRILITGGASGIGAASALLLASRGAKVVIGDMAEEMGAAVAKQGQDAGNSIVFKKVDVTSGDEVRALFAFAMETLGGLDV